MSGPNHNQGEGRVRVLDYVALGVPDGQLRLDIERIIDEGVAEGRASCFMTSDILRRIGGEVSS